MLFYALNGLVALLGFYLISKQKHYGWIVMAFSLFAGGLIGYQSWGFQMSWNDLYILVGTVLSSWAFFQWQKEPSEDVRIVSTWNENDLILDEIETEPIVALGSIRRISSDDFPFLFKSLFGLGVLLLIWGAGHFFLMITSLDDFEAFKGIENLKNLLYCGLALFGLWLLCYKYLEAWVIFILKSVYNLYFWLGLLSEIGFDLYYLISIGADIISLIIFIRAYLAWRKIAVMPEA